MININPQKIQDILTRGVQEVVVKSDLEKKLASGKRLRLYFGIDPTGKDLHLGHAVVLWKLRAFQEMGHEVILLIGDFTARIGDPSGRDSARVPLTEKQVKENMKNYKKQASKILDFSKVKIKYNSKWLSKLKFADILELSSHFTVQQMLARDMFARRMKDSVPISEQEFLYPLMQGYDSVGMDVDLEVAGVDQIFNALAGRTLQKIYRNKDKDVLTTKLLLGTDGRKMSKTFENTISLCEKPNEMFGKIMSIKDELIPMYFELCTKIPLDKIEEIKKSLESNIANPRDAKANLAIEIVSLYYGLDSAKKAGAEFDKVFKNRGTPTDIPIFIASKDIYKLPELLYMSGLASSMTVAKTLIQEKAVEIDNKLKTDYKEDINVKDGMIAKVGKRKFIKIKK